MTTTFDTGPEVAPGQMTSQAARQLFRHGRVTATSGYATGFTQANMISLPRDWAFDMLLFAQRNRRPVPLLDVTEPGATGTALASGADLRTDLPRYRIWRDGSLVDEPDEVVDQWRDDLITFLIGCSFSFEAALLGAGVPIRNLEQHRNVSMYRTSVPCRPAGRLSGPLVVSMRPIPAHLVATAVRVTARMPDVHGAPIHVGAPEALGITSLDTPDYGDPVHPEPGDIPIFWACGVTPQAVLLEAKPPFAITHAPGHMLITDVPDRTYIEP
jgi:uncharacterized protein YcsI (UPF0317 family)